MTITLIPSMICSSGQDRRRPEDTGVVPPVRSAVLRWASEEEVIDLVVIVLILRFSADLAATGG
jgi:hypothetical protein